MSGHFNSAITIFKMIKMKNLLDFMFSCFRVCDTTMQQEFYYCDSHSTWHSLTQSAQIESVSAIVLEEIDGLDDDDCFGSSEGGSGLIFFIMTHINMLDTDNDDDGYLNADMDHTDYQMRIDPEVASDDGGGDDRRGGDSFFEHYSDNFTAASDLTVSHQQWSYGYSAGAHSGKHVK